MKCIYQEGMSIVEIFSPFQQEVDPNFGLRLGVQLWNRFRFCSTSCPQAFLSVVLAIGHRRDVFLQFLNVHVLTGRVARVDNGKNREFFLRLLLTLDRRLHFLATIGERGTFVLAVL